MAIWMPDNVENAAILDINKDFFKTDAAQTLEQFVLFVIPVKDTHQHIL